MRESRRDRLERLKQQRMETRRRLLAAAEVVTGTDAGSERANHALVDLTTAVVDGRVSIDDAEKALRQAATPPIAAARLLGQWPPPLAPESHVWISGGGSKYHRWRDCQWLEAGRSKAHDELGFNRQMERVQLATACQRGRTACNSCEGST